MIAIIEYNAGNSTSVKNALNQLNTESIVTSDVKIIQSADKVIFPGVGQASTAMQFLKEKNLDQVIRSLTQPTLGICLGMQLLCSKSDENNTECLSIIPAHVKEFNVDLAIPHMGWNNFTQIKSPLFKGINIEDDVYFVHSYYVPVLGETIATTEYGIPFSAALQKDNFYATQFHIEKSGKIGQKMLHNFLSIQK